MLTTLLIVVRWDGDDRSEYLALADDRGNIYVLSTDSLPVAELTVDQRIGRTSELPVGASIELWLDDGTSGLAFPIKSEPMVMTKSGERLTLLDNRSSGLQLERGPMDVAFGDGAEIAAGDFIRYRMSGNTYTIADPVSVAEWTDPER